MILHHVTLLTGHTTTHRLDTLSPEAVRQCRALLPAGGQVPGFAAFRVELYGPMFTIFRGRDPLVTCAIGNGEQDVGTWQVLDGLQVKVGGEVKAPTPPRNGRWLGVVLLPAIGLLTRDDVGWLGDFERCLAAAMIQAGEEAAE